MDIPALIRSETAKIIQSSYQHGAFSEWHINTGWCYELSYAVSNTLTNAGIENEILDSEWLIKRGPNKGRPKGIGLLGYHEFVFANGKYYDSQVPDGVDSPYDLPIVQAAIVSRKVDEAITTYLDDPNSTDEFQCPLPVKEAFINNLKAFSNSEYPVDARTYNAAHVATQMLWEPVNMHFKSDEIKVVEAFNRILNSFGLSCVVETGEAAPELNIPGEHNWLRFSDGTILEVAFEKSPEFNKSKLGGQVRMIHPEDELNGKYQPNHSTTLTM